MIKKQTLKSGIVTIFLAALFLAPVTQLQAARPAKPTFKQQVEQWRKDIYQLKREKDLNLRLDGLNLLGQKLQSSIQNDNLSAGQLATANQMLYLTLQAEAKYPQATVVFNHYIDLLRQSKGDDYVLQVVRRNGKALIEEGDINKAKLFVEKGLDSLSNHADKNKLYVLAGKYYQKVHNWPKARFYLEKVVNSPGEPDRTVQLAMIYMVKQLTHENPTGNCDEAHRMLDRLVETDNSWAAYAEAQHGRIYLSRGQYTDALFKFINVQNTHPTSRYAGMVQAELDFAKEVIIGAEPGLGKTKITE